MAQIIWTDPALHDLDGIADHISLDKPLAARRFVRKVFKKVALLRRFPRLGTFPPELKNLPYRQIVVSPCRIFYRIVPGKIYVVSVLRGERMLNPDLLEQVWAGVHG